MAEGGASGSERRSVAGSRRAVPGTGWRRVVAAVTPVVAVVAVLGCESPTEPELASGRLSFEWRAEGGTETTVWAAEGSCGRKGFEAGARTCAAGSVESRYNAVLAFLRGEDGDVAMVTLVHPDGAGECEATAASGTRCSLQLVPDYTSGPGDELPPYYVLSSGTITAAVHEDESGAQRMTGTFSGTATDPNGLEAPLVITDGEFDVELVR